MRPANLIRMRQRRRHAAKNSVGKKLAQLFGSLVSILLGIGIAVPALAGVSVWSVYTYFTSDLPDPTQVQRARDDFQTTRIYDRNNQLLMEVIDPTAGDRKWVSYNEISPLFVCATVAIEDKTFFENQGFDLRGIARAFVSNLQGGVTQGGSSITQQVVKNVMLDAEERTRQSYERKIKEVLVAQEITRRYSKQQILEWYANTNNYGSLAYGIEAAARIYFNKSAKDLNLAEAAMLAAVPQFPTQNPFDRPTEAKTRQELVLDLMAERAGTLATSASGLPRECNITEQQATQAKQEQLRLAARTQRFNIKAPHFSLYARDRAVELLADHLQIGAQEAYNLVYRGGLEIRTTIDLNAEERIRSIANEQVLALQRQGKKVNNAAVVVLNPNTGEIVSMVGSRDYNNDAIDGKFNVALGLRQPGSSFKPITFLTLLSQGAANAATVFWDVRTTFPSGGTVPYTPENYDRKYHGPVRMRNALARSYNIPAVDALNRAGIGNTIRMAHRLGITDLRRGTEFYGLALTLGGGETKLLDMAYVYSVLAAGGDMRGVERPSKQQEPGFRKLDPAAILSVKDQKGNLIYEYRPVTDEAVAGPRSKQVTWLITSMLNDPQSRAEAFGFPSDLDLFPARNVRRDAAVKTGTTNDNKDNWTIGYTPDYVTAVWVGNTDSTPMDRDLTGLAGAAPIWNQVMTYLHRDIAPKPFPTAQSVGLVTRGVCAIDGLLSNGECPGASEWMIPGTEPRQTSNIVKRLPVLKDSGRLAPPGTPPEQVEERAFYVFPSVAKDWYDALDEKGKAAYPAPPTEFAANTPALTNQEVAITFPLNGGYIPADKATEIRGSAKGGNWQGYRIAFTKGFEPAPDAQWQTIGPDKTNQVENNVLETFNPSGVASGPITLRLTRIEPDRSTDSIVRVTVDDVAPKAKIAQPVPGQRYDSDEWVDVNAEITDNYSIGKVEFYLAGSEKPFAVKTGAPYSVKWVIPPGFGSNVSFKVVAYDSAGNRADSAPVTVFAAYKK